MGAPPLGLIHWDWRNQTGNDHIERFLYFLVHTQTISDADYLLTQNTYTSHYNLTDFRSRVDDQRESSVHLRTYVSLQTESDRGCARIDDSKATTE
jgi:hypothetical protein